MPLSAAKSMPYVTTWTPRHCLWDIPGTNSAKSESFTCPDRIIAVRSGGNAKLPRLLFQPHAALHRGFRVTKSS